LAFAVVFVVAVAVDFAFVVDFAVALLLLGPKPARAKGRMPEFFYRTGMSCRKIPAGGTNPDRVAGGTRRRGVLSFGVMVNLWL